MTETGIMRQNFITEEIQETLLPFYSAFSLFLLPYIFFVLFVPLALVSLILLHLVLLSHFLQALPKRCASPE